MLGDNGSSWPPTIATDRHVRRDPYEEPADPHCDPRLFRGARRVRFPVFRATRRWLRLVRSTRRPSSLRPRRAVGLARDRHGHRLAPRRWWSVGTAALGALVRDVHGRFRLVRSGPGLLPVPGDGRRLLDGDPAGVDPLVPEVG